MAVLSESSGPSEISPPPPENVVQAIVPLPASITSVRFPSYTAQGSRILAAATSNDFSGTQLVSFAEDGTDLRCLTCGSWTGPELLKPIAFPDGRRVLVRIGAQSSTVPSDHGVVECAPSVTDCRRATVVPIVPPSGSDPNVLQDQREFRVSPDGVHVGLTQVRRSATGRPAGAGVVGRLVRRAQSYHVDDARVVVADAGELKGFTPDGKSIIYSRYLGAFEAGNPDVVTVDLRTGRERRLTTALDWDEDVEISPAPYRGRNWMVVGSGRGTGLLETMSQVRRPPIIEAGIQALPFMAFATRRPQIIEPWLVDTDDARGGYLGQPLAPGALDAGWDSRANFEWKPDGTAVVFWQRRLDDSRSRVVIARLTGRAPATHPSPRPVSPPRWAPPLAGYLPDDPELPASLKGKVSGEIRVVQRPSSQPNFDSFIEVTYINYADQPGFVLNGVERSDFASSGLDSLYNADLRVSGEHQGYLRADGVRIRPVSMQGTIESQVDGRHLTLGPLP
ncbi:hypothetical protein Acsp03_50040 [Actinomadura sp. NBRC 104412]|uniref:hypothetical protein n=1 Tax=Actinomadura sp. NBRC 104412 TaxID=3032203 RepID=UPI0024A55104|nr:hypothetical protein [Actinomadura sp. NBRC 104412]GLZ07538.1 hypothetical protein Acsp03_50040 [Actinomadura sp. NBRC 104412]